MYKTGMRDSKSKSKFRTNQYDPGQQQNINRTSPWSQPFQHQGSHQAVPLPSFSMNPMFPYLPRGNGGFGDGVNRSASNRPQTKTEYFEVDQGRGDSANHKKPIKSEPWDVNLFNNNPVNGKDNLGLKHSYNLRSDAKSYVKVEQNCPPSFRPINEGNYGYGMVFNGDQNEAHHSGQSSIPTLVSDPKQRKKPSSNDTFNSMKGAGPKPKVYRRSRSRSKTKKYKKRSRSPSPPPKRYQHHLRHQSSTQYRNPPRSKSPVPKKKPRRSASKSKSPSPRRSMTRTLYGRSKSVFNEAHRMRLKKEKDYEIDRLLHVKKREEKLKDEEREFADRLLSLKVIEEEEKVNELKEERLERERKLHKRQKKLQEMKEEYDNLMSLQIQRSKSTRPVSPIRAKSRAATVVTKSRRRSKSRSRHRSRQNSRSHDRTNTRREKTSFQTEKQNLHRVHDEEIGSKRRSQSRNCHRSSSRSSDGARSRSVFDGSRLGRRIPARMRLGSRKPK